MLGGDDVRGMSNPAHSSRMVAVSAGERPVSLSGVALARPTVAVLEVDPDLASGLSAAQLAQARRYAIAEPCSLPAGIHDPEVVFGDELFGVLILDGLLISRVSLGDRCGAALLGPGAMLTPANHAAASASLLAPVSWRAPEPVQLALLDQRFLAAISHWPPLAAAVIHRVSDHAHALAFSLAIHCLHHAEARVLALMWHLADRFGNVTRDGTLVPVALNHSAIAELIGTARPSTTLALGKLADQGQLTRLPDRQGWRLNRPPPQQLTDRRLSHRLESLGGGTPAAHQRAAR